MTFRLSLLGRFRLLSPTGAPVILKSRKAQLLIAMLALEGEAAIPRTRLAGLLWADDSEAKARNSLRQAFSAIRVALAGHGPFPFDIDGEAAAIRPGLVSSDVGDLMRGSSVSIEAPAGEFLEGLAFQEDALDDWLRAARAQVRGVRLQKLTAAAADMDRREDVDGAARTARLILDIDPYDDGACRLLMRCLAALGEGAHAVRAYDHFAARLKADLGVSPDPETRRLLELIRMRRVDPEPIAATPAVSPHPAGRGGKPTLVVAPASTSGEGQDPRVFASALTHALLGGLGRFSALSVVAAATLIPGSQRLTGQEIGRRTGAHYVLECAVLTLGGQTRVAAECAHVATGRQVWAGTYDCKGPDLFAAQDDLARRICGNLHQPIMAHAADSALATNGDGEEISTLYLRSFHHIERPTADGMREARSLSMKILALDPTFALSREHMAWIDLHSSFNGWSADPIAGLRRAREQAMIGVAQNDREPYLVSALGLSEIYLGRIRSGLGWLQRAVDLNPNDAEFHTWLGAGLAWAGRAEAAMDAFAEAERFSPGYPPVALFRGDALMSAGRYDEAVDSFDRLLAVLPEYDWARASRAAAAMATGRPDAAREDVDIIRSRSRLTGLYLNSLLSSRPAHFHDVLWPGLEAAGMPRA